MHIYARGPHETFRRSPSLAHRIIVSALTIAFAFTGWTLFGPAQLAGAVPTTPGTIYRVSGCVNQTAGDTGSTCSSGTGNPMNLPAGVAVDPSGNIYIADSGNDDVLKTDSAGLTTPTVIASGLNNPLGVAVGTSGNVYIADTGNNRILKITSWGTGTLSVFAGTGTAGSPTAGTATNSNLNYPTGVAVDTSGNVYIADYGGNVVEKVTPSGTLSIIAGTGGVGAPTAGPALNSSFHGPYGVAVDRSGNIYIADSSNYKIEKIDPSGTLSIYATGFGLIEGIAVDSANSVYVAQYGGSTIVKITAAGTKSTVAGTGTAGAYTKGAQATISKLNNPTGVAVDTTGNFYIADYRNNVVEMVNANTPGAPTGVSAAAANGSVTVSFSAPSATGGSSVTSYTVTVTDTTNAANSFNLASVSGSPVTFITLIDGDTYFFRVTALNANGTGQGSADSASITLGASLASTTVSLGSVPSSGTFGGSYMASYSTASTGTTSMTSATTSVCTVSGSVATFVGVGNCTLTAHVAQSADYLSADGTSQTISVGQASSSTVINCASGPFAYTGSALTPCTAAVTGAGGLSTTATVSYGSNTAVGTATADASYAGDTNHTGSTATQVTFTIGQATPYAPTISNLPGSGIYGDTLPSPSVTADGDGATSVTSSDTSVCQVDGSGNVDYVGVGTCTLVAHVAAGTNYSAADGSDQSITIGQATSSTVITCFGPMTYSGSPLTPCAVAVTGAGGLNTTTTVTFNHNINAGTATADASYTGDANHTGSVATQATFTINPATPTTPVITGVPAGAPVGSSFPVVVSTDSDGTHVVTSSTSTICQVDTSDVVHYLATGTCTLTASTLASSNYLSSHGSPQSFVVQITPSLHWTKPKPFTYGTPLSQLQLDAGASVLGLFVYSSPAGTVLSAGSHTMTATFYPWDSTNYASVSIWTTMIVKAARSTTTLTMSASSIAFSAETAETFTVSSYTSTGVPNSGPVNVMAGSVLQCVAVLDSTGTGTCSLNATELRPGRYAVKATTMGNSNVKGSLSASQLLTVTP